MCRGLRRGGGERATAGPPGTPAASTRAASTPAPSVCAREGAIRWSSHTSEPVLVAVSPVVDIAEDEGPVAFPLLHVRTVVPRLDASEPVPEARILRSLERREGLDLARVGETSVRDEEPGFGEADYPVAGRFVQARAVRLVEADFTLDCAGTGPVHGHVTTWRSGAEASLQCGFTQGASKWSAWAREVYDPARGATS
ncbi:hypothetical protein [Streptomyces sp. NPDC000983]|uniref:hypothetical protein n=1 Tax=Streptomyces sp. NPDC000983 TaxID=3154373 RepID=UPI0033176ABB